MRHLAVDLLIAIGLIAVHLARQVKAALRAKDDL